MSIQQQIGFILKHVTAYKGYGIKLVIHKGTSSMILYESEVAYPTNSMVEFISRYKANINFTDVNNIRVKLEYVRDNKKERPKSESHHIGSNIYFDINLVNVLRAHNPCNVPDSGPERKAILIITNEYVPTTAEKMIHMDIQVSYKACKNLVLKTYRTGDNLKTLIWTSPVCRKQNVETISFANPKSQTCLNNNKVKLEFMLLNQDTKKTVTSFERNFDDIMGESNKHSFTFKVKLKSKTGFISFHRVIEVDQYSLYEYIKNGMVINCGIAVDFTISNGNPNDPKSLHYQNGHKLSPYANALQQLITFLNQYDDDKLYPVYGFGAYPNNNSSAVSYCFPLSEEVHCSDVNGVLSAYNDAIKNVIMSGPTNMEPIISTYCKKIIRTNEFHGHYYILIILTDGDISDVNETKKVIMEATAKPLSIIIIGIGNNQAGGFEVLQEIDKKLVLDERQADRDIVKFVAINRFNLMTDVQDEQMVERFNKEIWEEVPQQVQEYMSLQKIIPNSLKQYNISDAFEAERKMI